jgi:hypothetical protein
LRTGRAFLAIAIPDTLIVLGLAIEFLAIGRVIVAENEARSLSEQETAAAKERAAVAEQKANEARLELAKFRQPWGLSKEQWTRLRQKLIPFGQIDFEIAAQGNDPLAGSFADEIEQNLQAIGWRQLDWKDGVLVTKRLGMPVRGIISASGFHIFFRENLPWAGPAERSRRA